VVIVVVVVVVVVAVAVVVVAVALVVVVMVAAHLRVTSTNAMRRRTTMQRERMVSKITGVERPALTREASMNSSSRSVHASTNSAAVTQPSALRSVIANRRST
jgi:hypothetical protein